MIDVLFLEGVDYIEYGINNVLLIDNIGVFIDCEFFFCYMKVKGVFCVLLMVLGKEILNVVYGIN